MLNQIQTLDLTLTTLINSLIPHNSFFNILFSFFSLKGSSILIWIVIILLLVIFEEKKDRKFILYFFISFLTTAFLVNIVMKNVVMRPRPLSPAKIVNYTCPKDYSFPSGHASTAFAGAAILACFDKKRRFFYYGVAILISLSRIYLYCHFFLDIFIGALIGCLISKLILKLTYPIIKNHK